MRRIVIVPLVIIAFAAVPTAAQTLPPATVAAAAWALQAPAQTQPPPESQPPAEGQPAATGGDEQKKEAPRPHTSTSWKTLLKDTGQDFLAFPRRRSTWVILGVGAGAALAAHTADDYVESHIVGNESADKFFRIGKWAGHTYIQVGAAVGLWAAGRYIVAPAAGEPRTNKYSEIGFDLMRAQAVSQTIVHSMKATIRRVRPNGECCAFPSGHAASAFAAAGILERHLGYRASWPALAGAMYVAASRMVDNKHFLSDVMFGAAVGTASAWTVVGTRGRGYQVQPVPVPGGVMLMVMRTPE
jgi:hypothetical protein